MPSCFDPSDWLLLDNDRSYEGSKYQTDLLAGYFESQQQKRLLESATEEERKKAPRIRHLLVHPGVASTNIIGTSLGKILIFFMDMAFYIVRYLQIHLTHHNSN
jgi:3-keto steroid reductase